MKKDRWLFCPQLRVRHRTSQKKNGTECLMGGKPLLRRVKEFALLDIQNGRDGFCELNS